MTARSHRPSPQGARYALATAALATSAIVLAGCGAPTARPRGEGALYVPPLTAAPPPADPAAVRFADGAAPPAGCFGVSRKTGAVACLVGQYALEAPVGERRVTLLSSSEAAVPDLPVLVHATTGALKLAPQSQRALDTMMREGDFVALGAPVIVPVGSPRAFDDLVVELTAIALDAHDGSSSARASPGDLKVIVRSEARRTERAAPEPEDAVLFENTLSSVSCFTPSLAVRVLEPGVVLLERECRLDEGGGLTVVAGAWLCSSAQARCD